MLIDANNAPQIARRADFLIIGTGPAGLAIALELEAAGFASTVLEAGDLTASAPSQSFYEGVNHGITYPLDGSRMRTLGGSSNCWGGWCRHLEDIEFEPRPWMPGTGWPIQHTAISKYYAAAGRVLHLEGVDFDAAAWAKAVARDGQSMCAGSKVLASRIWQVSVTRRLAENYRGHLAASEKIHVIYNCAATRIHAENSNISAIEYCTANGKRGKLSSTKSYVLALGAIENARLLLNSMPTAKAALSPARSWIGKGFMEHPARINGWRLYVPGQPKPLREEDGGALAAPPNRDFKIAFGFGLTEGIQRARKIPGLWAVPGAAQSVADKAESDKALKLIQSMRGTSEKFDVRAIDITWAMEQAVNAQSRVELSDKLDAMGMPRVALTWKITEFDQKSVETAERLIAADFLARKVGRMRLLKSFKVEDKDIDYGNHHIGTTRMARNARDGVVDANCKVFGTSNLFVAGSGVFPTSAVTNPTLALTAMALRLADHLKKA